MLFGKTWACDDVTNVVYEVLDKKKDMKVKLTLEFFSKDACNKKNPVPRPKLSYKRCYDLKNGFVSVSNFYEVDPEGIEKLRELIKCANLAPEGCFKAYHRKWSADYCVIKIRRKWRLLTAISGSDELYNEFRDVMTSLVQ